MKILKAFAGATITCLLIYLLGSFGCGSFNIKEWAPVNRGFTAFIMAVDFIFIFLTIFKSNEI